jgi:hypothetical protein
VFGQENARSRKWSWARLFSIWRGSSRGGILVIVPAWRCLPSLYHQHQSMLSNAVRPPTCKVSVSTVQSTCKVPTYFTLVKPKPRHTLPFRPLSQPRPGTCSVSSSLRAAAILGRCLYDKHRVSSAAHVLDSRSSRTRPVGRCCETSHPALCEVLAILMPTKITTTHPEAGSSA